MSQNVNPNDINADELWRTAVDTADAKRSMNVGGGLTENSVQVLKRVRMGTGGIMTKAATGMSGNEIKSRRILNLMILLDGSGSMHSKRYAVVDGLNTMFADLKDEQKSPQRNSIFVTIWIFSDYSAELFTVNGQEISNMPVTKIPEIKEDDYQVGGMTPMNKTALVAMGAGSLRTQALANQRKGSMNYLVIASDGKNNVWHEDTAQGRVDYSDGNVKTVSLDLLQTEEWILAFALAGGGDARSMADKIGFPHARGIDGSAESWRSFFGFVSQSVQATSKAAINGTQKASQIVQQNGGNSFFS